MNTLNEYIEEYIEYCKFRKRLDPKTLKAYCIDLKQYVDFSSGLSYLYKYLRKLYFEKSKYVIPDSYKSISKHFPSIFSVKIFSSSVIIFFNLKN